MANHGEIKVQEVVRVKGDYSFTKKSKERKGVGASLAWRRLGSTAGDIFLFPNIASIYEYSRFLTVAYISIFAFISGLGDTCFLAAVIFSINYFED